jgi:hypothetical protein
LLVFEVFILIAIVLFIHILFSAGFWDGHMDWCRAVCSYSDHCWFLTYLCGLLLCCLSIFVSLLVFEMFIWIGVVPFVPILFIAGF